MEIKFIPTTDSSRIGITEIPKPAKLLLPDWYKSMPILIEKNKKIGLDEENMQATNTTVKACSPFLDAMSFGYIWSAPGDMEIKNNNDGSYGFRWRTQDIIVDSQHHKRQHPGMISGSDTEDFVMRWFFPFVIETPPGYSTMFTHPLNRWDLPFRTLSGVVDTDKYQVPVQFPFQILSKIIEERLIIEQGTPLCQFFAIKREPWHSEKKDIPEEIYKKNSSKLSAKIVRSYKTQFWNKKSFD